VYLRHTLETTDAAAALGYAAFSLTMAAGRFLGDALVGRLGDERVVRRFTGMAPPCRHNHGIANLILIVFAPRGLPGVAPSEGIAAVGTFGYVGFLTGPPLIGLAAELLTLPVALGLVVIALAWIAHAAPHVRGRSTPAAPAEELQRDLA
jgi:hypothetical protein